jgi:uncharacterized cupredoxin-like copper-binding protein
VTGDRTSLEATGGTGKNRQAPLLALLVGALLTSAASSPPVVDWSKAQRIDVTMDEYRFVPDHLTFRRGLPYRLHLENRGKELHEFTAPAFFATVTLRDPHVLWTGGQEIVVQPGASADVDLIPRRSGHYDLICADHDWAGMTGEIVVQ